MAKENKEFIELVIEGPYAVVKAWVTGYLQGKGVRKGFYFSRDCHIKRETLAERVMEWAGLHTSHTFIIISKDLLKLVEESASKADPKLKFNICARNKVEGASFKFYFHAFTKEDGAELKNYFEKLPAPLELKNYEPHEEVHEDAKAIEGYAPLHNYELNGSGIVEGPFLDILKAHQGGDEFALASLEEIKLKLTEIKKD